VHVGTVGGEGDVARHGQGDVVALTDDLDARSRHARAQLLFLTVLVVADRAAGDPADRGSDQRVLEFVTAREQADHRPGRSPDTCAGARLVVFRTGRGLLHGLASTRQSNERSHAHEHAGSHWYFSAMKRPRSLTSRGAAPKRWRRRDGGPHAEWAMNASTTSRSSSRRP